MKKPSKETLSDLMLAAQNGDVKAYRKLLSNITPLIEKFLYRRVFNKDLIDDIVQDILLGIHRARHTYLADQPFENWMYGIARHKLIDFIRKQRRLTDKETSIEQLEAGYVTFPDTSSNKEAKEVKNDLKRALDTLPPKQRDIVKHTKIQGHSIAETAQKFQMSESAIKVTIHRALQKMEDWLIHNGYA